MKPLAFDDLARLPILESYQSAFRKATGVSLKLIPPPPALITRRIGPCENEFCRLVAGTTSGGAACLQAERRAQANVARQPRSQQFYCYAGLTVVGSPVVAGGRHVATFLSGQVFRREPTERDFLLVLKMVGPGPGNDWVGRVRKAYFETPVLDAERFQAVIQLLEMFAQYLADFANRHVLASRPVEPRSIADAKEFVQAHVEEPISLEEVVKHVHVSRFYFCKLFKKVTGLTLTEYVARARVEKAKALLCDPSRRISEVVFASGFGSIPQFNSVFKRHVGMPPTDYRANLHSH